MQGIRKPAWLLAGRPLPFVTTAADSDNPAPADTPQAIIPVERIRSPILLDCGTSDTEWTSCNYLDAIINRLHAHGFRYPVISLKLDGGHLVATDEPAEAEAYAKALDLLASLTSH